MDQQNNDDDYDESDVFRGLGIRVKLPDNSGAFLKVKETLTRMGIASRGEGNKHTLTQSCHILHKRKQYAIMHFKEMFLIDGKNSTITDDDLLRRDMIARLLEEWNLVELLDKPEIGDAVLSHHQLAVIPHSEKCDWIMKSKYSFAPKKLDNKG